MFIYFFNGSHSYLGVVLVSYYFFSQDRKKKLKGGGGAFGFGLRVSKDDLWYKVFTEWTRGSEGVL